MQASTYHFQGLENLDEKKINYMNCTNKSSQTAWSNSTKLCIFNNQYMNNCKVKEFFSYELQLTFK